MNKNLLMNDFVKGSENRPQKSINLNTVSGSVKSNNFIKLSRRNALEENYKKCLDDFTSFDELCEKFYFFC